MLAGSMAGGLKALTVGIVMHKLSPCSPMAFGFSLGHQKGKGTKVPARKWHDSASLC